LAFLPQRGANEPNGLAGLSAVLNAGDRSVSLGFRSAHPQWFEFDEQHRGGLFAAKWSARIRHVAAWPLHQ
jgi:hypothetical protein